MRRVSLLPVGTIICRDNSSQQLADPVDTHPHQLPTSVPRDSWEGDYPQKVNPTSTAITGPSSYPDDTKNLKGQDINQRSLNPPTSPPCTTKKFKLRKVGRTIPNPGPHSTATAAPNTSVEALQQFISRAVPQDELPSLIRTIFSDEKTTNMADCLRKSDAQAFINAIDGVCHHTF